jgi:23S rRNA pseudouridine1911/1915/1917 synthase
MKQKSFYSISYSIIYEDDSITAVNKTAGISVSADRWDPSRERLDALLNGYYADRTDAGNERRVFTVHRIDKDTSGIVVFARNGETHRVLSRSFEEHRVHKRYLAVVHGRPSWQETSCDLPLVPDGNKAHLTIIDRYRGKKSLTHFRVLGSAGNYTALEIIPETGRTHQIRVHARALGHPLVCDSLYGNRAGGVYLSTFKRKWSGDPLDEKPLLDRLGLHALELILPHPQAADKSLDLQAPLPRDMAALIRQMEKCSGRNFAVFNARTEGGEDGGRCGQ